MSIKPGQNVLYIRDKVRLDLSDIKEDVKARFLRDAVEGGVAHAMPKLIVNVAATHAGVPTRNHAFYRPDAMKAGLPSFNSPYNKPVQIHHNDRMDPVGRVTLAKYVDISNKYIEGMTKFRNRYGGKVITDAAVNDFDRVNDQIKWLYDNLMRSKDYSGLGYGELQLTISDKNAAEKILDQRYLTVSVGFATTGLNCSACGTNWADDGPCEHKPGQMYDDYPALLVPANFSYEEVSWVNNPADPFVQIKSVMTTNVQETQQDAVQKSVIIEVVPILLGEDGNNGEIYRINFADGTKSTQEELTVTTRNKTQAGSKPSWRSRLEDDILAIRDAKKKKAEEEKEVKDSDKDQEEEDEDKDKETKKSEDRKAEPEKTEDPEDDDESKKDKTNSAAKLGPTKKYGKTKVTTKGADSVDVESEIDCIEWDDSVWPTEAEALIDMEDVKRENRILDEFNGHKHRAIIDPVTGNGYADYVKDHSHSIVNNVCEESGNFKWDEKEEKMVEQDKHKHEIGKIIPKLEDNTVINDSTLEFDDSVFEDPDKFYDSYIAPILDDIGATDAKLSTEKRKELGKGAFCGPNRSFPVTDCAHVTAARRLIGRYKGPGSKAKILACVERKAKSLGCNSKSEDATGIVKFTIDGTEYAVSSVDDFTKAVTSINKDQRQTAKDSLFNVAKVFGMTSEEFENVIIKDELTLGKEPETLESAVDRLTENTIKVIDEATIKDFIGELVKLDIDRRNELVERLMDELHAQGLIPDFDQEYADLVEEKTDLEKRLANLMKSNKDLYLARQEFLAEKVTQFSEALGKDGFKDLTDDSRALKLTELKFRSIESLNEQLETLLKDFITEKKTPGIEKQTDLQPGSVEAPNPISEVKDSTESKNKFDINLIKGLDGHTFQSMIQIQEKFFGGTGKKRRG